MNWSSPDLTQHPPRSARVRLGGYVILARMLDKGRATVAGKQGDYKYACPLDQQFLTFAGIDPEALRQQLGKSDSEVLEWINANAIERSPAEIAQWSAWQEQRMPGDPEMRDYFNKLHRETAPKRGDVYSWFDLLDVDDYASYGGKP